MLNEEILDIVDDQDQVIGQAPRNSLNWKEGFVNFRAVNAFILNDKGQLWIPRRSASKKLAPLHLDVSVGGCVASGESYQKAFAREAAEEINLDIKTVPYHEAAYLSPYTDNATAFMKVYIIKMNTAPDYNQEDFCQYYWLTPQEVLDRLANGDKSKRDLPKLINLLYRIT